MAKKGEATDAEKATIRKGAKGRSAKKNLDVARKNVERNAGRSMTAQEAAVQGVLEKDLAELQRQERRQSRQKDADIEGRNLAEESRQRRVDRELEGSRATVADPMGGNAAAIEFLPANAPGGANKPWVADEATTAIARRLGTRGFPVQGSPNTDAFISSGQPKASSAETADDVHIANLIRNAQAENAKRVPNKGTIAQIKAQLSNHPTIPFGSPSLCPHSGCTNAVPFIDDKNHPDVDAAYGSVACDSCRAKGLKSGEELPHLQSFTRRGNPAQTDFFNIENYQTQGYLNAKIRKIRH